MCSLLMVICSARSLCDRYLLTSIRESGLNQPTRAQPKASMQGGPINEATHFTYPRWSDLKGIK
jgi:hypothetical protein